MITFPALACAIADRRIEGNPFRVYQYLLQRLDLQDWREVKYVNIQVALGIGRRKTIAHVNLLVALGYIEKGEQNIASRVFSYRLKWACPIGAETAPSRTA